MNIQIGFDNSLNFFSTFYKGKKFFKIKLQILSLG